jgi:nucleoside diphosphate kinase
LLWKVLHTIGKLYFKLSKCTFFQKEVEYLGHTFTSKNVWPTDKKIAAVKKLLIPTNVSELHTFC